ncbi:MAG: hypothetical protein K2J65_00180 [Duncaniella sp.]|nr:hypothetical protein [Duncaniella sp.]
MELTPVLVCAVVFGCIYKIFELFVRKNERMRLIDKLDNAGDMTNIKLDNLCINSDNRYTALKWGLFAIGLGAGLFVFVLILVSQPTIMSDWTLKSTLSSALILLGGGLGLVIAFLIEYKLRRGKEE